MRPAQVDRDLPRRRAIRDPLHVPIVVAAERGGVRGDRVEGARPLEEVARPGRTDRATRSRRGRDGEFGDHVIHVEWRGRQQHKSASLSRPPLLITSATRVAGIPAL